MRRLIPFFLAIVAPLGGLALALHLGTIDVSLLGVSGMRDVPRLATLPPLPAEPETAPPAWVPLPVTALPATPPAPAASAAPAPAAATPIASPPAATSTASSPPAAPLAAPAAEPPARAGVHNPNVRHATLGATVCRSGYTRRIRPRLTAVRGAMLATAGVPSGEWHSWQLDHRVPLALGGSARDPANLMLQPRREAEMKNRLEVKLQCLVCTGQVPLHTARDAIARDWQAAYHRYAKVKCHRPRKPRQRPA